MDAVIDCMFDIQAAIRPSIYETNAQRKVGFKKPPQGSGCLGDRKAQFSPRGPSVGEVSGPKTFELAREEVSPTPTFEIIWTTPMIACMGTPVRRDVDPSTRVERCP